MDNIGPIDRSAPLPVDGRLEQSDATGWMALFCLNMLEISLLLAERSPAYEDMATKFLEHFAYIATAIHDRGLWDDDDGFYYDVLRIGDERIPLRVRSMVGLLPLCAVTTLGPDTLRAAARLHRPPPWFVSNKPQFAAHIDHRHARDGHEGRLLSIVGPERLQRILSRLLDEYELLSPYGVRSVSARHRDEPFTVELGRHGPARRLRPGRRHDRAVRRQLQLAGADLVPGQRPGRRRPARLRTLLRRRPPGRAPDRLGSHRRAARGRRRPRRPPRRHLPRGRRRAAPGSRTYEKFHTDPAWHDTIPFHEYFHGDTGAGLGASHQTGWTGLVADLLLRRA